MRLSTNNSIFRLLIAFILIFTCFITTTPYSYAAKAEDDRGLALAEKNRDSSKRVALVIGNSTYRNSPLKNPVNDAKDIAVKLRKLGFEVIERNNLTTRQIGGTLREFRSRLAPGAVALVFYAGHGLQIKGDNYLPAVDADINSEEDVPNQSIAIRQIMDVLDESKSRLNLVFLDACRNNPYARSFRSSDRGLARVNAPSGTLISYATKPGSVAADGTGRNGLYTSKLLAQMDSNQQIEQSLKRVVTEVKAASKGKQEPWMEGSIEGDFCFSGCTTESQTTSIVTATKPLQQEPAKQTQRTSDSLDDIIASAETEELAKKERLEHLKADLVKYNKIVASPRGTELKETAWKAIIAKHPEAANIAQYDTVALLAPYGLAMDNGSFITQAENEMKLLQSQLPVKLDENILRTLYANNDFSNIPPLKSKIRSNYSNVSKAKCSAGKTNSNITYIFEVGSSGPKITTRKSRTKTEYGISDSIDYKFGLIPLATMQDGKPLNYTTSLDVKGGLFPMHIGAEQWWSIFNTYAEVPTANSTTGV